MTETTRQPASGANRHHRQKLYRTVLSLAVAALLAAWLPFSVLYINALSNHAVLVAKAAHSSGASLGQPVGAVAPVTTRTS